MHALRGLAYFEIELRANGRVIRGRIGVQIDQVTKEVAESIRLPRTGGALVRNVEAGGPAGTITNTDAMGRPICS